MFHCLKYELLQMQKQGSGAIVNTASIGGIGNLFPSMTATLFGRYDFVRAMGVLNPCLLYTSRCV